MNPPKLLLRFFRWFCHPKLRDHIEGDLMELHRERVVQIGKRRADIKFIIDVLLLFRKGIIKPTNGHKNLNSCGMYKSYFKIGWRNLAKNKGYSLINIGGLAIGMAVAMVIGLWVYDELTFNQYHENYPHIAQVMKAASWQGKHYVGQKHLPYPLIDELKTNYGANFKHVVPISGPGGWAGVLSTPERIISKSGMYIGEEGPEMFTFRMMRGNWSGLNDLHAVMISQSTAKALFGDDDAIDKTIKINTLTDAKVTGVFEDFPRNSALFGVDFFQPWSFYLTDATWIKSQGWQNHFLWIYAEINSNTTFEKVGAVVKDAEMKAIRNLSYMQEELKYEPEVLLLPMKDWHLRSSFKEGELQIGPVQLVWFIGSIGMFVLLLACINFMNLSTARSEKRAKEVGIRKAIGSYRAQLIGQFFSESYLVVIMAFVISLVIVTLALPWFNRLSSKDMSLPFSQPLFWLATVTFLFITGLLAGSYPALYLSSFKPVTVLKGVFRAGRFAAAPRRVLVVIQFTVSVMLVISTGVIYNQLVYVKNRPVGYDREGLIMMQKKSAAFTDKADALKAELKNSGAVSEIAESGDAITNVWSNNGGFSYKGESIDHDRGYATLNVSHDFGRTVGWRFIDGRDFSKEMASDSSGIVINEAAAKFMGLKNPVGEFIHWKNVPWGVDKDFKVLGLINDMVMDSPFRPVGPAIYILMGWKNEYLIRVTPGMAMTDAIPKIEGVFRKVIPDVPFTCEFADSAYAAKFATEDRIGKLAGIFAVLAIMISCLGLFGLASFVAEQRTKEIGIRKVMGASVSALWQMLSREFVILVLISSAIGVPLSYFILEKGIQQYEYRTDLGWWIFALAALGALIITLLTVSFQSIKAALANPVESLRTE